MSVMSTYENAGRRYCKENKVEFVSADTRGCKYKTSEGIVKKHKWDSNDEKVINFSYYGARGLI